MDQGRPAAFLNLSSLSNSESTCRGTCKVSERRAQMGSLCELANTRELIRGAEQSGCRVSLNASSQRDITEDWKRSKNFSHSRPSHSNLYISQTKAIFPICMLANVRTLVPLLLAKTWCYQTFFSCNSNVHEILSFGLHFFWFLMRWNVLLYINWPFRFSSFAT